LIRQGAKLIAGVHDILEEITPQIDQAGRKRLEKEGSRSARREKGVKKGRPRGPSTKIT